MEKVIKDGQVAVLISRGFGAGWSTWADDKHRQTMLFDADMVNAVLEGDKQKAAAIAKAKCDDAYTGGAEDLEVVWIPQGTAFVVEEYDGSESIRTADDLVNVA